MTPIVDVHDCSPVKTLTLRLLSFIMCQSCSKKQVSVNVFVVTPNACIFEISLSILEKNLKDNTFDFMDHIKFMWYHLEIEFWMNMFVCIFNSHLGNPNFPATVEIRSIFMQFDTMHTYNNIDNSESKEKLAIRLTF